MIRYLRILFIAVTAIALLALALANRAPVTFRLLPEDLAAMLGLNLAYQLPLFLVILVAVAAGVMIGFIWEWFREWRIRGAHRVKTREVARLERELAVLKDSSSTPPQDEVLALIEPAGRR
ncbi:LapA family protein [Xinfangfangia pollutisoli]|uniref:LapA family protein n=1 Tax=Xinfangfangia pollutisoli TaxID=2865960 RepID=UPI001CD25CED|nr:LapA family protein [Xinfangfangia pollutisoli]